MPIHLNYQGTTCKKCGAEFIAHKNNCECPTCGLATDEFCDFAVATIASMKDHKQLYGKYFPDSWFSGSVADAVQGVIFEIFDNYEIAHSASSGQSRSRGGIEKPEDFTAFVLTQLETAEWEEGQEHLALQIEEIALEVYGLYKNDPDFKENKLKEKPINPKLKNLNSDTSILKNFDLKE